MRVGMVGPAGPGMRQVMGFKGSVNEKSNLGGECGRPIVTSGDFVAIIKDVNKILKHDSDGS